MVALLISGGLVLLYLGAEGLVRGSSVLSLRFGISPLLIGLTVVAFGTSAPELIVTVIAGLEGHGDVAVGNIIGSNIFNIAFILGLAAILRPLRIQVALIRRDIPIMILASLVTVPIIIFGGIGRTAGLFLVSGIIIYILGNIHFSKWESKETNEIIREVPKLPFKSCIADIAILITALGFLILGSRYFVTGSIMLAHNLGISEAVIGLIVVAAGTSLPELATSLIAAARNKPDIAVGNIVGSNIFNIFCILGISSLISPVRISGIHLLDVIIMIMLSIILLPFAFTKQILSRWEGVFLFTVYLVYIFWLWSFK